jgi:hypothetical protein
MSRLIGTDFRGPREFVITERERNVSFLDGWSSSIVTQESLPSSERQRRTRRKDCRRKMSFANRAPRP